MLARPDFKHIPVILNPAAGPERPVLRALNAAFQAARVDWSLHLTKHAGDARRLARQLLAEGVEVVAVYGGDGTIKEVAAELAEQAMPLAILPGGTGNALALELGIPLELEQAVALACGGMPAVIRAIDMGQVGERRFVLRASIGLETALLQNTDRPLKEQWGHMAYALTALQQIPDYPLIRYDLTLDQQPLEAEGVLCAIANSAQIGWVAGLTLAQGVSVSDGWLDVIVLSRVGVLALAELATSNLARTDWGVEIRHWRAKEITVLADPPQAAALGGDVIGNTPVSAHVLPGVLQVIVPAPAPAAG